MKALLVMDMQNALFDVKDFSEEKKKIEDIISIFKANKDMIICTQHMDENEDNLLFYKNKKTNVLDHIKKEADFIIEKSTPDAFYNTNLDELLKDNNVDELIITGFNTEYCCMFTAIAAFDRGYKVKFIEDATGTVCNETTYEMPGLDIKDFVGSVLNWSNLIEVLYYEEFIDYMKEKSL